MANNAQFGQNSELYPSYHSANVISLGANSENQTFFGTGAADSFQVLGASKGRDTIVNFDAHDTLAVDHRLYDGNRDGYIDFSNNQMLDVNRTGSGNGKAGNYQIAMSGSSDQVVSSLRYMGTKSGENVYGSAATRDQLLGHFTIGSDSTHGYTGGDSTLAGVIHRYDDTLGNDTFDAGKGSTAILIDNATGLNFGADTINNFGDDDLLVLTSDVYKHKSASQVGFGTNGVFDLSAQSPSSADANGGPGGQVDVNGVGHDIHTLTLLGSETLGTGVDQATYYFYGTENHGSIPGLHI